MEWFTINLPRRDKNLPPRCSHTGLSQTTSSPPSNRQGGSAAPVLTASDRSNTHCLRALYTAMLINLPHAFVLSGIDPCLIQPCQLHRKLLTGCPKRTEHLGKHVIQSPNAVWYKFPKITVECYRMLPFYIIMHSQFTFSTRRKLNARRFSQEYTLSVTLYVLYSIY